MLKLTDVIGVWRLLRFEIESIQGDVSPWGSNVRGTLIYTSDGYVSVGINSDPDPECPEPDRTLDSILFYSGTYRITGTSQITHHIMNASDRERIGHELVRKVVLADGVLSIEARGEYGVARLVWANLSH